MSITIGQTLFKKMEAVNPETNRDDYFDEETNKWDVKGLEDDLRLFQNRLEKQEEQRTQMTPLRIMTGNSGIAGSDTIRTTVLQSDSHQSSQADSHHSPSHSLINSGPTDSSHSAPSTITLQKVQSVHLTESSEGTRTVHNVHTKESSGSCAMVTVHALPPSNPTITEEGNEQNGVKGVVASEEQQQREPQEEQGRIPSDTMPSPNASPSIEYHHNNEGTESDREGPFVNEVQPRPQMVSLQAMSTASSSMHRGNGQNVTVNDRTCIGTQRANGMSASNETLNTVNPHSVHSVSRVVHSVHSEAQPVPLQSHTPSHSSMGMMVQNASGSPSRKRKSNDSRSSSPSSKKGRPGRKRKNSEISGGLTSGGSPPSKRARSYREEGSQNAWNALMWKKLQSLKRQVKNSAWYVMPMSAANVYILL